MAQSAEKVVLFLCADHHYQSRFAELVFNDIARKFGLRWKATSRGLALEQDVTPVSSLPNVALLQELEKRGIKQANLLTQIPPPVTETELEHAQRIVCLQQPEEDLHHQPSEFIHLQGKLESWQTADVPEALGQIEVRVNGLVARLLGGGDRPPTASAVLSPVSRPLREKPTKAVTVKVGRETAGRRGKGITTVFDLPLDEESLRQLAATLKQRCGTGGTVKDGRIEMQGDLRDRLCTELEKLGYQIKRVGG